MSLELTLLFLIFLSGAEGYGNEVVSQGATSESLGTTFNVLYQVGAFILRVGKEVLNKLPNDVSKGVVILTVILLPFVCIWIVQWIIKQIFWIGLVGLGVGVIVYGVPALLGRVSGMNRNGIEKKGREIISQVHDAVQQLNVPDPDAVIPPPPKHRGFLSFGASSEAAMVDRGMTHGLALIFSLLVVLY